MNTQSRQQLVDALGDCGPLPYYVAENLVDMLDMRLKDLPDVAKKRLTALFGGAVTSHVTDETLYHRADTVTVELHEALDELVELAGQETAMAGVTVAQLKRVKALCDHTSGAIDKLIA